MKFVKLIVLGIFDPISSFVTKAFPDLAHKFCNKNILIQALIALSITLLILFVWR